MGLALAIISLVTELGPLLSKIWADLSDEDRKLLEQRYREAISTLDQAILVNNQMVDDERKG